MVVVCLDFGIKMDKTFIVYKHENKINGKRYYGLTCQKPQNRWRNNGKAYKGSPRFYNAIQKYGWNNFEHKILIHGLTEEQAKRWESKLILKYKTNVEGIGYNLTNGGEFNQLSEETKVKIGKANKKNMENGVREKIKESLKDRDFKGEKNPYYGKHHSEEIKRKMSENHWTKTAKPEDFVRCKKVINIITQNIYYSINDCLRKEKIGRTTIFRHLNKNVKIAKYMYYDEYLYSIIK